MLREWEEALGKERNLTEDNEVRQVTNGVYDALERGRMAEARA